MPGIYTDRQLFIELGDIFRDAQLMLDNRKKPVGAREEIANKILKLASEGRSPSEIRSKIIDFVIEGR